MRMELGVIGLGLLFVGAMVLFLDETALISTSTSYSIGVVVIVLGAAASLVAAFWLD